MAIPLPCCLAALRLGYSPIKHPPGPKVQRRGNKKGPPARKLAALLRSLVYPPNLAVLGEVLDGADHLRGVAVLVVVPGHDLNLIGVVEIGRRRVGKEGGGGGAG